MKHLDLLPQVETSPVETLLEQFGMTPGQKVLHSKSMASVDGPLHDLSVGETYSAVPAPSSSSSNEHNPGFLQSEPVPNQISAVVSQEALPFVSDAMWSTYLADGYKGAASSLIPTTPGPTEVDVPLPTDEFVFADVTAAPVDIPSVTSTGTALDTSGLYDITSDGVVINPAPGNGPAPVMEPEINIVAESVESDFIF